MAERVKRELRESQHEKEQIDLDDTDGLDPNAEFAAWRLRELQRVKRTQDEELELQREREETARRRALPEAQRLQEDLAHARQTRESKSRGQLGYMQKYRHRGAFFQDMDILKRDMSERMEDEVDKSTLPQIMQESMY